METAITAALGEDDAKRGAGRYYTLGNPFVHPPFLDWARRAGLPGQTILEPFAGRNSLIGHLRGMGLCREYRSFDIAPAATDVERRDTLSNFPEGFRVCVTNPPWLAKNSATRRGLPFRGAPYDDLYKAALGRCLTNCEHVAALVPESFLQWGPLQERLESFTSLPAALFADTRQPVALALFVPESGQDAGIWSGDRYLGTVAELRRCLPSRPLARDEAIFNCPDGNLGLIAFDNVREASIRFCDPGEIEPSAIKHSSRFITRIRTREPVDVERCNRVLQRFRQQTGDMFLTPYRGLRKDGCYRRRLDYATARLLLAQAIGTGRFQTGPVRSSGKTG